MNEFFNDIEQTVTDELEVPSSTPIYEDVTQSPSPNQEEIGLNNYTFSAL